MIPKFFSKKLLLPIAIPAVCLYLFGQINGFQGSWVDGAVSKILTREFGFTIRCREAKFIRWSQISFSRMTVGFKNCQEFLGSGRGHIRLPFGSLSAIQAQDVRLSRDCGSSRFLLSLPISKSMEGAFQVDRLSAGWSGSKHDGFLRIYECGAKDFSLKGGVVLKDRRVFKAHLYFSISPERSKRLPGGLAGRMIQGENGWVSVRIIFDQNKITLSGANGPVFQAIWQV